MDIEADGEAEIKDNFMQAHSYVSANLRCVLNILFGKCVTGCLDVPENVINEICIALTELKAFEKKNVLEATQEDTVAAMKAVSSAWTVIKAEKLQG